MISPRFQNALGEELTNNLIKQIKPFNFNFHLNDRVQKLSKENESWIIKTTNGKEFNAPNVVIAGGSRIF